MNIKTWLTFTCLLLSFNAFAAVDHRLAEHTDTTLSHVGFTWDCSITRVNGNAFDCTTEGDHFEVRYSLVGEAKTTDNISINTSFADYDLGPGEYEFEVLIVDNEALRSDYTDLANVGIVPISNPMPLLNFTIMVNGGVAVTVTGP